MVGQTARHTLVSGHSSVHRFAHPSSPKRSLHRLSVPLVKSLQSRCGLPAARPRSRVEPHGGFVRVSRRGAGCRKNSGRGIVATATTNGASPGIKEQVTVPPFKSILAANRGEIAVRIVRAADEMLIKSIAVYSPADRLQAHRFKAVESYQVGTSDMRPVECYLDIEGIIAIAKEHGVEAIHPGYGFLSENATFARRCAEEGITFIGPKAETIESMGDKTAARRAALECGVAVVPGMNKPVEDVEEGLDFAKEAGFPVMLKAAMGGGGRGMRVVRRAFEFKEAFTNASREAQAAFGDGRMFVEKYVEEPRHIEIQILADNYGNVVHLYERDCSVQRRHQKVVEMAPSVGLAKETRESLYRDAVKLAKHVGYRNAGTVEFMVDRNGKYYFLEVNPRIQVEHCVTEEVTGIDIVQKQILVAGGASLADIGLPSQDAVPPLNGFAIQCRVTSEDPQENFQPDSGRIEAFRVPGGPGIRLDGAVTTGNVISQYYDSLLCKVIACAPTFSQACQKMQRALNEFHVRGIKTNVQFLSKVLQNETFLEGAATTGFIDSFWDELMHPGVEAAGRNIRSTRILQYLADMVVNGPDHPGAVGPPPSQFVPSSVEVPPGLKGVPLTGWRDILVTEGPDAWAQAVRKNKGVLLTDTTWRDAHQSLFATRLRTHDILKVAPATAHLLKELASLEMWGGATFDVALRFLHECPWERLEKLRELVPNIPFQMLFRGANAVGYTAYPDNVVREFVKTAKTTGMDIFRIFDSLNYVDNLKFGMDEVRSAGGVVEAAICYTGDVSSPQESTYNLDYYLELAHELVGHGVHVLAIKDMAGLLKPKAATMLVAALRKEFPNIPIHVHTHDSAGTGVATQIACARAGADIIDAAIDSMSGLTSQPSMGAIAASLEGTDLDTDINVDNVVAIAEYWEHTRGLYAPFEASLKSTSSDVYYHQMPGGQYTNLKFQAQSLGLGEQWEKVKTSYAAANRALGNIVKVTPSSKVVGDLAQFLVQNDLDEQSLVEQADALSLPKSVVEFLQGYLGQPVNGFPEPLRSKVLKDRERLKGRPGTNLRPLDLDRLKIILENKWGKGEVSDRDVISAALYPQVFDDFKSFQLKYGKEIDKIPTRQFLEPLEEDEEVEVELMKGVVATMKYKAIGELQSTGHREVFFEANGVPRVVEVIDKQSSTMTTALREKSDPTQAGSIGAPMAGDVVEVSVKPGAPVTAGQQLVVLSAMKMETAVCAPLSGVIQHVAVVQNDKLDAGDLIVKINPTDMDGARQKEVLAGKET